MFIYKYFANNFIYNTQVFQKNTAVTNKNRCLPVLCKPFKLCFLFDSNTLFEFISIVEVFEIIINNNGFIFFLG